MKRIFFDCGTRDATASLGIFALRVMVGLMMFCGHGVPKIMGFATLKDTFYVPDFFPLKYMSPPVSLIACITAEFLASLLIILGLALRPAAFVLGFNMVVAAFAVQASLPWFLGPAATSAKEPALLYLIPLITIILTGAGAYSLDARLYSESKRRRW
jgi:putative oxidoreductase